MFMVSKQTYTKSKLITNMERAARAAAEIQLSYFQQFDRLDAKEKQPKDFVTIADKKSEEVIIQILKEEYPDYGFIGEESGQTKPEAKMKFVIDPLDGTVNFMKGIPFFCISIGLADLNDGPLENINQIQAGLIYVPCNDEVFYAERGEGSFFNDKKLKPFETNPEILYSIGFKNMRKIQDYPDINALLYDSAHRRFLGAAALELAYLSVGRLDKFVHCCLNPWDMAAAVIILQELNIDVKDLDGGVEVFKTKNIIASI